MHSTAPSPILGGSHERVNDLIGAIDQVALDGFVTVAGVSDGHVELLGVSHGLLHAVCGFSISPLRFHRSDRQPRHDFQYVVRPTASKIALDAAGRHNPLRRKGVFRPDLFIGPSHPCQSGQNHVAARVLLQRSSTHPGNVPPRRVSDP